jgi:hypothetical protein
MKLLNGVTAALLLAFSSVDLQAQSSETGAWLVYFGNNKISKNLNWHNEVQYRSYDIIGDTEMLLLRTGIGYTPKDSPYNLLAGYAYIQSESYNGENKTQSIEHRPFQQITAKQETGRLSLLHRYRLEERIFQDNFRLRFRYLLLLNVALNSKTIGDKTIYAAASNEVFLNGDSPVFDQDRLYGGVGYCFKKSLRLEIGYMQQFYEESNNGQIVLTFLNWISFEKN